MKRFLLICIMAAFSLSTFSITIVDERTDNTRLNNRLSLGSLSRNNNTGISSSNQSTEVYEQSPYIPQKSRLDKDAGWGSFYFRYNTGVLAPKNGSTKSFNSVGIGMFSNITIGDGLYIEFDFTPIRYAFYSKQGEDFAMYSANIASGLAYEFEISKSFSLIPQAGIDAGFIYSANLKDYGHKYNLFKEEDMGSKDATWNHFLFGVHIGIDFLLWERVLLGLSYQYYLTPLAKDMHMRQLNISLGYTF